jgi:uncharacterized protein (TIGR03435 family)
VVPIYALVLVNAGKTGSQLTPYSDAHPCVDAAHPSAPTANSAAAPLAACGALFARNTADGAIRVSSSDVTIQKIADDLSIVPPANIDRPVVDRTGLTGNFDFTIDLPKGMSRSGISTDDSAPPFVEVLRDQLGLKLDSTTAPVNYVIIDHIEEPSPN